MSLYCNFKGVYVQSTTTTTRKGGKDIELSGRGRFQLVKSQYSIWEERVTLSPMENGPQLPPVDLFQKQPINYTELISVNTRKLREIN